jgi:(p)ppGpp synthase/HD superfamily hydrolase
MQLTDRFTDALVYATTLHATQVRKGSGVPYVAHLLGVASLVLEYGGDEDEAIAALLHDAIEDCGGAVIRDEIRRQFGDRVTEIVEGCTDQIKLNNSYALVKNIHV